MQSKHIIPIIIGVLAVAGGAFYGGTVYAKRGPAAQAAANRQFNGAAFRTGANGAAGQAGQMRGGAGAAGLTAGEVLSKDDTSITVKLQDGGSKIVFYSASTTVSTISQGSMNDVTPGTNVMVGGSANQDGSVMARSIQIRPAGETGMPMFAPRGDQAPDQQR